jgi:putative FmdB family regulatory protein
MPIYEYECAKCGDRIEVIQKMSDDPLKKHEGCGGKLTKLISAAGFQFKGTGWYVTDYARKGSTEAAESSKNDSASRDSKDSKESKQSASKETSSNGSKEGNSGKSVTEKASKKDSSSRSGTKKD